MNQSLTNIEKHLPVPKNSRTANSDADWLCKLKTEGANNFSRLGFPTARKGNERWKYTDAIQKHQEEEKARGVATLTESFSWIFNEAKK